MPRFAPYRYKGLMKRNLTTDEQRILAFCGIENIAECRIDDSQTGSVYRVGEIITPIPQTDGSVFMRHDVNANSIGALWWIICAHLMGLDRADKDESKRVRYMFRKANWLGAVGERPLDWGLWLIIADWVEENVPNGPDVADRMRAKINQIMPRL